MVYTVQVFRIIISSKIEKIFIEVIRRVGIIRISKNWSDPKVRYKKNLY